MTKHERDYARLSATEGFDLRRLERRGGHLRLHYDAGYVVAACTPSDVRNLLNVRSQIRRLHR